MVHTFSKAMTHPFKQLAQTLGRNKKARNVILGLLTLAAVGPNVGCVSKSATPSMDSMAHPAGYQTSISTEGQYANVKEGQRYSITVFKTTMDDRPATVISVEDKKIDVVTDYGRRGTSVAPKQSTITLQKNSQGVFTCMYDTTVSRLGRSYELHIPFDIQNEGGNRITTMSDPVNTDPTIAAAYSTAAGTTAAMKEVFNQIDAALDLYRAQSGAELNGGYGKPAMVGPNTVLDQINERDRSTTVKRQGYSDDLEVSVTTQYRDPNFPGGVRPKTIIYTPTKGVQSLNDWVLQDEANLINKYPDMPFNQLPDDLKDKYTASLHVLGAIQAWKISHPNGCNPRQDPMATGVFTYLDTTNFSPPGWASYSFSGSPSNTEWPILDMNGSPYFAEALNAGVRTVDQLERHAYKDFKDALKSIGPSAFTPPQAGSGYNNMGTPNPNRPNRDNVYEYRPIVPNF